MSDELTRLRRAARYNGDLEDRLMDMECRILDLEYAIRQTVRDPGYLTLSDPVRRLVDGVVCSITIENRGILDQRQKRKGAE